MDRESYVMHTTTTFVANALIPHTMQPTVHRVQINSPRNNITCCYLSFESLTVVEALITNQTLQDYYFKFIIFYTG